MSLCYWLVSFIWAALVSFSCGSPDSLTSHAKAPSADTYAVIGRSLLATSLQSRDTHYSANKSLDTFWKDVPLFSIAIGDASGKASVSITCKTCYITGVAFAELQIESNSTVAQILDQTITNVTTEVDDIIDGAVHKIWSYVETEFKNVFDALDGDLVDGLRHGEDASILAPPQLDLSLDVMNFTAIPATTLIFRFQELDIYMDLDVTFNSSASYAIPLYSSADPAQNGGFITGISLPNGLELGVFFTVDLILNVDASLDITGGLHIKVDEYVKMEIALFGDEISGVDIKGGRYEHIPITVYGTSAVFTAMLKLGARAAMEVGKPLDFDWPKGLDIDGFDPSKYKVGGGLEVGVYADVAVFTTNITEKLTDDVACKWRIEQDYSFVLGATAAAQVTLGTAKYGPAPSTSTPVYYTTLKSYCVDQATSTAAVVTATATAQKRQDDSDAITTTALTKKITQTAIQCPSTITGNCPVSLQTTTTKVVTLTTTVSGSPHDISDASYPSPTITPLSFGTNVKEIRSISGSPSSYNPSPIHSALGAIETKAVEALKHHKELALGIGIGVGMGVPALALIAYIAFICPRRRKYTNVPATEDKPFSARPMSDRFSFGLIEKKEKLVRETEYLTYEGT